MAESTLEISFPGRSAKCSILFGDKLLERLPIESFSDASSLAIVTDDIVARLYGRKLLSQFSSARKAHLIVMKHGERNKNLETVSKIAKKMSLLSLDRKSSILALGGGVVGDLAGFVASIYKRGISYFQLPTTLLAQVDSSIGGKCGVDTDWGKNQIGSFHQPLGVFVDTSVLDTLPEKEVVNGVGEIIKSSIIADREMFHEIESRLGDFYSIRELRHLVRRTAEIKCKVIEKDEREANIRKILNYGHTVGHAIESSSDYKLSHGKSVILGMICEGWIAKNLGIFEEGDYLRQKDLLETIRRHYKIRVPPDKKKILSFAALDKKNVAGQIKMSFPEKIGKMHEGENETFATSVSKKLFLQSLDSLKIGAG